VKSVLLSDNPAAERLSDLSRADRAAFLESKGILGEAVERACSETDRAFLRVNLEILGNTDRSLHAHVWPRYSWEPPEFVGKPVWLYPQTNWTDRAKALGPEHNALREAIAGHLDGSRF
jgi:diadenosine tetraphosphate (Ap4A) HIT family hydrolase